MSNEQKLLSQLKTWKTARLIPTLPESKKEERATSILLATFRVVPAFALDMLREAGAPTGKRVKIYCLTEVVPKTKDGSKLRPDGIVVLDTGRGIWSAIVEAKVGNCDLTSPQLESYLTLARELNCDAIITISNQFCAIPTHHPVGLPKNRLGKIGLYHFSWLSLISRAVLLAENKQVNDPEQAFILDELIRYLRHQRSGVSLMTEVGPGWKRVSQDVLQGSKLMKSASEVEQTVGSWQELTRFLALQLTIALANSVTLSLSRKQAADAATRVRDHVDELTSRHTLTDRFIIPNAASPLTLTADFTRRAINFAMSVAIPKDKTLPTACVNWLLRQIKSEDPTLLLRASWPGRTPQTMAPVQRLREDASLLVPEGLKSLPTGLEVVRVIDLAGKFGQKRKFIEIAESEFIRFYKDVGEHLRNWVAPAPKVKREQPAAVPQSDEPGISLFETLPGPDVPSFASGPVGDETPNQGEQVEG